MLLEPSIIYFNGIHHQSILSGLLFLHVRCLALIIVKKDIRDLNRFLRGLEDSGYTVEEGAHAVITDQSEIQSFRVLADGETAGIIISHYITPYYRVEAANISDEDAYLKKLIEIKHSGEKWRIPVDDLIIIIIDEKLIRLVDKYRDEYPVKDGNELVEFYRARNPGFKNVVKSLLARILETVK
jgi:hypothetical protein